MRTARETINAIRCGELSADRAVGECLDAIQRKDPDIGAFLSVSAERARDRARHVDRRLTAPDGAVDLPLAGLPVAVKDNLCTDFGTTTCASKILEGYQSPYSAHVVERLERAGAIVIGKCNLDEFAMGASNEYSAYKPVRNPWDGNRVAGGSSGGPAAAVAAGMVPVALGSDTGGSIRMPASLCGVVGLKPTYGRVSRYGLVAFGSSLDQVGPLARTVEDAAMVLSVIAGHDPRDATSLEAPIPDYAAGLAQPIKGTRIGMYRPFFADGLEQHTRQAVEHAIDVLTGAGATTVEVDLPHAHYAVACYYIIATAECSSNLARFDGVHYGHRTADPDDIIDLYAASRHDGFGPEVIRRIMLGAYALSSGYYDAYYLRAMKVRTLLRRDFARAFENVDVIVAPVSPTTAYRLGEKCADPLAMYLTDVFTTAANLAGLCAMSVPCGFDDRGLPIGMQLIGPVLSEQRLLALGHQYQQLTDHHLREPA